MWHACSHGSLARVLVLTFTLLLCLNGFFLFGWFVVVALRFGTVVAGVSAEQLFAYDGTAQTLTRKSNSAHKLQVFDAVKVSISVETLRNRTQQLVYRLVSPFAAPLGLADVSPVTPGGESAPDTPAGPGGSAANTPGDGAVIPNAPKSSKKSTKAVAKSKRGAGKARGAASSKNRKKRGATGGGSASSATKRKAKRARRSK